MANRSYTRQMYSLHQYPVYIDAQISIGASGAVGTVKGSGIASVVKLATGFYQINFQDNYYRTFAVNATMVSPTTGSTAITALSAGTVYVIATLGTSATADWVAAGLGVGITPAVGVSFVASGVGTGTGTCSTPSASGITTVEIVPDSNLTVAPTGLSAVNGYVIVQTLAAEQTGTTTAGTALQYAPANPVSGSVIKINFMLSNSSVLLQGE